APVTSRHQTCMKQMELTDVLFAACREVLPLQQAEIVLEPGEGALADALGDGAFRSRAPRTIFHRMRGGQQVLEYVCPCPALGGLPKSWRFESAKELASAIVVHLDMEGLAVHITRLGEFFMVTKEADRGSAPGPTATSSVTPQPLGGGGALWVPSDPPSPI
ncbi:unnamed protein product, partial [Durusdinium trenchii]